MESSSILPPSARLLHLWPIADRIELIRRQGVSRHEIAKAHRANTEQEREQEKNKCSQSAEYFIQNYIRIYDATRKSWIPFRLWSEQVGVLITIQHNQLVIILKARQVGLTWVVLAYALWLMLFHGSATVLIFSLRDTEAVYLLDERLKQMHAELPAWMRQAVSKDSGHQLEFANGSIAKAFPTSAGDSYTATLAIVDEADLVPDLNKLMRRVKPTIDGGGQLVLLSRSDKKNPQSEFKRIYRAAKQKLTKWVAVFLPWYVRPDRDERWYAEQKADVLYRTGGLDDLHEQYPATDTEALAPSTLDKRIPALWLNRCYAEQESLSLDGIEGVPSIEQLKIYRLPEEGRTYVVGIDPAEGNPTSDDSSLKVLDSQTGEECASLTGKFQPSVIAAHADSIGCFYNNASVMVERNNHGHAVLLWLADNSGLTVLCGLDGRPGWLDNSRGKAILYDTAADAFKDQDTILHDFATYTQIASIEGATLRAPSGELDDLSDAYALALVARVYLPVSTPAVLALGSTRGWSAQT